MNAHRQSDFDWKRLFRVAVSLIDQANRASAAIDRWTLGGGTALMLHLGHRESHDVDIFVDDPQVLGFLNPDLQDLCFDIVLAGFESDGSRFVKFSFQDMGEIDFIVAPALTDEPAVVRSLDGVTTLLETAPEIVAKKIFFRGARITPRDIFDIAVAGATFRKEIVRALQPYRSNVGSALETIGRLNPEFVATAISQLMIRRGFDGYIETALKDTESILLEVS